MHIKKFFFQIVMVFTLLSGISLAAAQQTFVTLPPKQVMKERLLAKDFDKRFLKNTAILKRLYSQSAWTVEEIVACAKDAVLSFIGPKAFLVPVIVALGKVDSRAYSEQFKTPVSEVQQLLIKTVLEDSPDAFEVSKSLS